MLKHIRIRNIGPYKDTEADFGTGKISVIGENGAGKTMLLKCINMGLWGGNSKYILNTNLDEFIRREAESGTIELQFDANGAECEVKRTWNRNEGNEARLETPTKTISGITNVDREIERLFKIPSKNWIDISWAKQGEISDLLEGDKDVFDRLLGIADLENAWLRLRGTVSDIDSEINTEKQVIRELKHTTKDEGEIKGKIEALRREVRALQIELQSISITRTYEDKSQKITELKTTRKAKNKEINTLETVLEQGDVCPTCKQEIDEEHKEHVKNDIRKLKNDVEAIERDLEGLSEHQRQYEAQQKENRRRELKKTEMKSDIDNKQQLIAELQNQMNKIEEQKRRLKKHRKKRENLEAEMKTANIIRDGYRLAQPYLREGRITKLQYGVSDVFKEMFGDRFSNFSIDSDYNMTIYDNGHERDTATLSGGESVALGIALRLSIVKEIGNQNLLILDEPTSHLDKERIDQLTDVIEKISTDDQIFIVTHQELLNAACDSVITVKRDAGSSKIKNEVITG